MRKIIAKNGPQALGPYVHAIEANGVLYVSGCVPINPSVGKVDATDIKGQTKQALANIETILKEAGYVKEHIVKCNVFLTNLNDFANFNAVYADFFAGHKPARVCVEVSKIAGGSLVEIDATAVK